MQDSERFNPAPVVLAAVMMGTSLVPMLPAPAAFADEVCTALLRAGADNLRHACLVTRSIAVNITFSCDV
jgi:hypothetical protein